MTESWRLISWNICGGGHVGAQVAALNTRGPALVALQDVFPAAAPAFQAELAGIGLPHCLYSLPADPWPVPPPVFGTGRLRLAATPHIARTSVLLASRWPITELTPEVHNVQLPWPERLIAATVHTPAGPVAVYTVYLPHAGHILPLYHSLRGLYTGLGHPAPVPRILCGDFNCPVAELPAGWLRTHGQTRAADGTITVRNQPMEEAEQAVLRGLAAFGLVDVYRALHGPAGRAISYQDTKPPYHGLRIDHVLAAPALGAQTCCYHDAWRKPNAPLVPALDTADGCEPADGQAPQSLSDHAAVEVTFAPV